MAGTNATLATEAAHESRSRYRLLVVFLGVMAMALATVAGVLLFNAWDKANEQAIAGTSLAEQVRAACKSEDRPRELGPLCDDANEVIEDGQALGIGPQGPQGDPGQPGEPGQPGPPPSDAQVADAVALYCSTRGNCRGVDGQNATRPQITAAVALYCNDRGECQGPEGGQGESGPQGPPPSADQINAAVAEYCGSRGDCRGPEGPQGDRGPEGPTGVIDVDSNCQQQEGQVIDSVAANYNPETRTITITCTYEEEGPFSQGATNEP